MKKTLLRTVAALLSVLCLSSCTVVREKGELPESLQSTMKSIREQELAEAKKTKKNAAVRKDGRTPGEVRLEEEFRHGRKLLKAFLANDGKAFVNLLPARLQKEFDRQKFDLTRKAVTESMGEPVSFRYVTALEMVSVTPHIWAVRFKRVSRDGKEEYFSEMLFRVITGTLDGKPHIIGFNFF